MEPLNLIGKYEEREFPDSRQPAIDTLMWGSKRHHIPMLLEIDVTTALNTIYHHKQAGDRISFTGWIVKCIAQAASEHQYIHGLRSGKRRLVIFDDVDVTVIVEREIDQSVTNETLPMPYIVRRANQKGVATISAEIHAVQKSTVSSGEVQIGATRPTWLTKLSTVLPRLVRNLCFWQPLFPNPFRFKSLMGTVSVTTQGMKDQSGMSWGIPIGIHPLIIALGAIAKRHSIVDDQIVIREYVGITILFDRDVSDWEPVASFIRRLQELITGGYELKELSNSFRA